MFSSTARACNSSTSLLADAGSVSTCLEGALPMVNDWTDATTIDNQEKGSAILFATDVHIKLQKYRQRHDEQREMEEEVKSGAGVAPRHGSCWPIARNDQLPHSAAC